METALEALEYENSVASQIRANIHKRNPPFEQKVEEFNQIPVVVSELVMHDVILVPPAA